MRQEDLQHPSNPELALHGYTMCVGREGPACQLGISQRRAADQPLLRQQQLLHSRDSVQQGKGMVLPASMQVPPPGLWQLEADQEAVHQQSTVLKRPDVGGDGVKRARAGNVDAGQLPLGCCFAAPDQAILGVKGVLGGSQAVLGICLGHSLVGRTIC